MCCCCIRGSRDRGVWCRRPFAEPDAAGTSGRLRPRRHRVRLSAIRRSTASGAMARNGDGVAGVDLRSGKFRNAVTDPQLRTVITNGFPTPGCRRSRSTRRDDRHHRLPAQHEHVRRRLDEARVTPRAARSIFEGKGACLSCHRVGNVGSRMAPNLSDIGAQRSAGSLQRSLRDPSSQMMPINRPVRLVTRDGTVINGRRLNEDTYSVQIDRRRRAAALAARRPTCANSRSRRRRRCRRTRKS